MCLPWCKSKNNAMQLALLKPLEASSRMSNLQQCRHHSMSWRVQSKTREILCYKSEATNQKSSLLVENETLQQLTINKLCYDSLYLVGREKEIELLQFVVDHAMEPTGTKSCSSFQATRALGSPLGQWKNMLLKKKIDCSEGQVRDEHLWRTILCDCRSVQWTI